MQNRGVIYCATGPIVYLESALISAIALRQLNPELPITLVCEHPLAHVLPLHQQGIRLMPVALDDQQTAFRSRDLKTHLGHISPYQETLYLDADILPIRPLTNIWDYLAQGDMAMVRDRQPTLADCDHIAIAEKAYTLSRLPSHTPQYNSGVMLWRHSSTSQALFNHWQREWQMFQQHDQLALVRAIDAVGMNIVQLPVNYNISPIDAVDLIAKHEANLLHCWGGQVAAGEYRRLAQRFYPDIVATVQMQMALLPQDQIVLT
jgi:hypothetical protein